MFVHGPYRWPTSLCSAEQRQQRHGEASFFHSMGSLTFETSVSPLSLFSFPGAVVTSPLVVG
jgi:hypothetical protein